MAETVKGVNILNTVKWADDVRSRKRMFQNIRRYKRAVASIRMDIGGLGEASASLNLLNTRQRMMNDAHTAALREIGNRQRIIDQAHSDAITEQTARQRRMDTAHSAALREQARLNSTSGGTARNSGRGSGVMGPPTPPLLAQSQRMQDRVSNFNNSAALNTLRATNAAEADRRVEQLGQIRNERTLRLAIVRQNRELREINSLERARLRTLNHQNFAQQRLGGSMRQMAGAAFSIYTAVQGISSVAKTGMEMQRVDSAMLAVSDNAQNAKENVAFVREETLRLGGDLVQNSKALSQLLANRGSITKGDTKALFSGIAELSTARGLTADEVAGAVKAIGQMMG